MIGLIILFVLFLSVGLLLIKRDKNGTKRELIIFTAITTIGATLWASIILQHPLDLNRVIAWINDSIFSR